MEFKERNKKPEEASKNLPMVVLITLVGVVCLLLYVGWQMISDDASDAGELKTEIAQNEDQAKDKPLPQPLTPVEETQAEEEVAQVEKPQTKSIDGAKTTTHTVQKGETLFSIANRYNLESETLASYNPNVTPSSMKVGAKLTIPVMAIHVVGPGDILRVVGGKYGVTVEALMKANGKTKNFAQRGEKLVIPFKDKK
ncbi:LysM peptidoglycan-binding domain-containing protein [Marinilongibacter aquaticus]|uniref:LysM peptidoglycan-binding domain-containing protein n=1 Tax=Marinilongibacter aquaticus TaxID=2975157 RepID=UPI0021BDE51F|nr:LysM peptidoglycan-binding domain-containing protein [Marinilongibacter aquaticus]UBM59170.1 LysM peptidoglycan-binding domain-containing protein [Marinilongibacter aquaticus]